MINEFWGILDHELLYYKNKQTKVTYCRSNEPSIR